MSYGMRGRSLESAVGRAAKQYERRGRAFLHHRPTPTRQRNDGTVVYAEKAGVDFEGHDDVARALYVECKETRGKSFPLADITDGQVKFMDARKRMGARCLLVIDFTTIGETFAISWEHVQAFMLNPWRESLSVDWCRAFGVVLRHDGVHCWFLDGEAHPEIEKANALVLEEKTRARFKQQPLELPRAAAPTVKRSKDEILSSVRDAVQAGIGNQLKRKPRRFARSAK